MDDERREMDRRIDHLEHPEDREYSITLKELAGFFVILGSMASGWVSLNNSQVETETRLNAFESYYKETFDTYKISNEKASNDLKDLIVEQKKLNKELVEQVNDLENSVTQIYRLTRK